MVFIETFLGKMQSKIIAVQLIKRGHIYWDEITLSSGTSATEYQLSLQ